MIKPRHRRIDEVRAKIMMDNPNKMPPDVRHAYAIITIIASILAPLAHYSKEVKNDN